MKIGLMYGMTTYPPSTGGTIHGYQLVKQLAALGHEVVTCFYDHGPHPDLGQLRARQIGRFLRSIDVLYIRAEWQTTSVELSLLRLLRLRRLPVVWEFNGTSDELRYQGTDAAEIVRINRRLRRWSRLCDGAVAVTQDVADYVRREVGVADVCVVPNGSDPELFGPAPVKSATRDTPLEVVWIGTSTAGWHDLATLLDAARRLHADGANVVFSIYGDPRALPADLPANVRAAGVVPYAQLGAAMREADVGVHLFRHDPAMPTVLGSPLKVFDYMATGLAVITNCDGQQSDIIATWNCGLKCDGSAADLARTIAGLARDRASCDDMGRNGRRAVERQFNWARVGAQTEAFLERLCSGARVGAPSREPQIK